MPGTRKLYEKDAYCTQFCARVVSCEPRPDGNFSVVLTETAFYPEGGGQPADQGALGGARVLDVHEAAGVVTHVTSTPLRVGEMVQGDLDWARRFAHMQQHTGEHIISGIVHSQYGYDNVGFHIGGDVTTVDFSGPLTAAEIDALEENANWVVWNNVPVTAAVPGPEELAALSYRSKKALEGAVRIVTVADTDCCACCGTHVARTGQVGLIKILSGQSYKGGLRLTLVCGVRAARDYRAKTAALHAAGTALSAAPEAVPRAVEHLLAENAALKARRAALESEVFALRAREFAGAPCALVFAEDLSGDSLRRLCLALCAQCPGVCAAFCPKDGGFSYAVGCVGGGIRAFAQGLNGALSGRGGGSDTLAQGTVQAGREAVEAFFAKACKS